MESLGIARRCILAAAVASLGGCAAQSAERVDDELAWQWRTDHSPSVAPALAAATDLRIRSLRSADLSGLDLDGVDLAGADLRDARLDGASLKRANLSGALLDGASLVGASLHGAKLSEASLRGADLRGSWLYRVDFRGADLRGAVLKDFPTGLRLDTNDFRGARVDGETRVADCAALAMEGAAR
jgi:uncharacterized protein YjbI with pentapeptide repeats